MEKREIIIISAAGLNASETDSIRDAVSRKIKEKLPVKTLIDKSLLGGFVVRVGDWTWDASLITKLKTLRSAIIN